MIIGVKGEYQVLSEKINAPTDLVNLTKLYFQYLKGQKRYLKGLEGKKYELGDLKTEEDLSKGSDTHILLYYDFMNSAEKICKALQKKNKLPPDAHRLPIHTFNREDRFYKTPIFFNGFNSFFGHSYADKEIISFLLINSKSNVQETVLSEASYPIIEIEDGTLIKEILNEVRVQIGSGEFHPL